MTCSYVSSAQSEMTSSLANLMNVTASRVNVTCEGLSGTEFLQDYDDLLTAMKTTASSELNVTIHTTDSLTDQVTPKQAATTLESTDLTEIAQLPGFEENSVLSAQQIALETRAPTNEPGEAVPALTESAPASSGSKSGLSGGAIFGIIFACLILIGGVVGAAWYKINVVDPKKKQDDLLRLMLEDAKKPRPTQDSGNRGTADPNQLACDFTGIRDLPRVSATARSHEERFRAPSGAPQLGVC